MSPPSVRLGAITGTLMGKFGVRCPPAGTYSSGPGTARRPVWIIQSLAKRLLMAVQNPPHPGGIVKRQGLEPLELTLTRAAKGIGISHQAQSDLINGHAGISAGMAVRLSETFGSTPGNWRGMQVAYDWRQAHDRAGETAVE